MVRLVKITNDIKNEKSTHYLVSTVERYGTVEFKKTILRSFLMSEN